MGDRATFVIEQENGQSIYLYSHWGGEGMMDTVAYGLNIARPRWGDEGYATRIFISQIIANDWKDEAGYGITTYFCDSEHSVPVINFTKGTVRLIPHDYTSTFDINTKPKFEMSLDTFVKKFSKTLTSV
jgi:hypothetical protein